MKQLALDLSTRPEPSFGNFVPGGNREALVALQVLARGAGPERFVYLWGAPGSGRSHLLRAVVREAADANRSATCLHAPVDADAITAVRDDELLALDDVERLDAAGQRALFGLFNRLRAGSGALVASGCAAPAMLSVRPDLATRLAWGLVYEVHALSDAQKAAAVQSHARARGFDLPSEVLNYLLRHAARDLPSLLALVEGLDRHSLEQRRAITVPLAREVLKLVSSGPETP
ncbi:MAG: DnaA regulatory inactivator Hda [Betaproteobacteria bacterium]|nr:MAG: DnaA regulatory inactivator Hda [Betaproteobacteria bacterium]